MEHGVTGAPSVFGKVQSLAQYASLRETLCERAARPAKKAQAGVSSRHLPQSEVGTESGQTRTAKTKEKASDGNRKADSGKSRGGTGAVHTLGSIIIKPNTPRMNSDFAAPFVFCYGILTLPRKFIRWQIRFSSL